MKTDETKIEIRNLTMAYGSYTVMRDIAATVQRGSIFVIMGNSGSGKSTLLRHMLGLQRPAQGDVLYDGESFWGMDDEARQAQLRKYGVLFQSGALWSSMTLAENVARPLVEGLRIPTIAHDDRIWNLLGAPRTTFDQAIRTALLERD